MLGKVQLSTGLVNFRAKDGTPPKSDKDYSCAELTQPGFAPFGGTPKIAAHGQDVHGNPLVDATMLPEGKTPSPDTFIPLKEKDLVDEYLKKVEALEGVPPRRADELRIIQEKPHKINEIDPTIIKSNKNKPPKLTLPPESPILRVIDKLTEAPQTISLFNAKVTLQRVVEVLRTVGAEPKVLARLEAAFEEAFRSALHGVKDKIDIGKIKP